MISCAILEDNDLIEASDLVRQLSLVYSGQSDYLETSSTYGGGPVNRLGWIPAWIYCPAWVGKKVGDFKRRMPCNHEFLRGTVPEAHMERLSRDQMRIAKMGWRNFHPPLDED
jgi:hypothetical protein